MRRLLLGILGGIGAFLLLMGLKVIVQVSTNPRFIIDADMLLGPPIIGGLMLWAAFHWWARRR